MGLNIGSIVDQRVQVDYMSGQCCQIGSDFPPNQRADGVGNLAQSGNTAWMMGLLGVMRSAVTLF